MTQETFKTNYVVQVSYYHIYSFAVCIDLFFQTYVCKLEIFIFITQFSTAIPLTS
jgi:hypothetical protein